MHVSSSMRFFFLCLFAVVLFSTGVILLMRVSAATSNLNLLNTAPDSSHGRVETFPVPSVLTNAAADLNGFNLTDPNGTWSHSGTDSVTIATGWTLRLTVPRVFTVNSTADTSDGVCDATNCTLREALNAADATPGDGDLITFSSLFNTPQTIEILNTLPQISKSMAIQGPGANLLTVRRSYSASDFSIFRIGLGIAGAIAISDMTVAGGRSGAGGGIFSQSSLTLTNVHLSGNFAGGIGGGGVAIQGSAEGTFTGCTFSGNKANQGSAIYYQGEGGSTLRLINSTFSGNGVANGTILNNAGLGISRLEVVNSTVVNNLIVDNFGGRSGIRTYAIGSGNTATTTLRNTIVANNAVSNLAVATVSGGTATFETLGFNLSDNYNGVFAPLGSDITSSTPRLAPLALYGGQTPTHALLHSSPAIGAGDRSDQTTDQRGQPRPNAGADIGAVEMQTSSLLTVTNTSNAGPGSLRNAIGFSNSNPTLVADILFDNNVFNTQRTITLGGTELVISGNANIIGPGANLLRVSGNSASRVFSIDVGRTASMSGLTITDGNGEGTQNGRGGGIYNTGNLTIANSTVSGNWAGAFGGGISNNGADAIMTISGSTVFGNSAATGGTGGGIESSGFLNVVNSTVSGNTAAGGALSGGGIYLLNGVGSIVNSTIANNSVAGISGASGVYRRNGNITIRNSIIAGNVNNGTQPDVASSSFPGSITSNGFNLIGNRGAIDFGQTGDQSGTGSSVLDPRIGLLANYGGTTATHALFGSSTALDRGNSSGSTTDQRGSGRPIDLVGITNTSDGSDIGAFEAQTTPVVDDPPTAVATAPDVLESGPSFYIFTVTYADDFAVSVNTIGTGDVTVTGPNGFTSTPTISGVDIQNNGSPRIATYFFFAPGGFWDPGDNGTYNVMMQPNQVADTSGNFVAAGQIGSFTVNLTSSMTFTVTNLSDSGAGSLRQAVLDANANNNADVIRFQPGLSGTILLNGQMAITGSVVITGPGANVLTVSGNGAGRIFNISGNTTASLSGLTITGGTDSAINNTTGATVSLDRCSIVGNSGIFAGAIDNTGTTLIIRDSTISNNTANGSGAAGGVGSLSGTVTITNSTISGNAANAGTGNGGGLRVGGNGTLNINNSTITNNAGSGGVSSGGGIYRNSGTVTLSSTIVAANQNNATQPDVSANGNTGVTSSGFNLVGNRGALTFNGAGDQSGTNPPLNPQLGILSNNGGPTLTHGLLLGSPAADAGNNPQNLSTDQRGLSFPRVIGGAADTGAFEAAAGTPTPTNTPTATPTNTPTATPTPGSGDGFESDVAPRTTGDGVVFATDVTQIRRFVSGLDTPGANPNEFQRADSAPRASLGDGLVNSGDVVQARRYAAALDSLTNAGGPTVAADVPLHANIGGSLFGKRFGPSALLHLDEGKDGSMMVVLKSGTDVAAVSFGLRYDPALGRPLVSEGELPDGAVLTVNDTVAGELTVLIDSDRPLGKSLRLVSIAFEKGSTGRSVEFDGAASLSDGNGNAVPVEWMRGK